MARIALDVSNETLLIRIQCAFQLLREQVGESNDRVERRPKFMTHAGEEFAFEPVRSLNFPIPYFELLILCGQLSGKFLMHRIDSRFSLFAAGDITHDRNDARPLGRTNGAEADLDWKLTPVFSLGEQFQAYTHRSRDGMFRVVVSVLVVTVPERFWNQNLYILAQQLLAFIAKYPFRR